MDTTSDGDVVWSYDYTPEQLVITSTPTLNGNILLDAEELVLSIVLNSNFDFVYMIDAQVSATMCDPDILPKHLHIQFWYFMTLLDFKSSSRLVV